MVAAFPARAAFDKAWDNRPVSITPREASRLRAKQARIERMEAHARRDGVLTGRERERIEVAQNDLSRSIRREKHDDQVRR